MQAHAIRMQQEFKAICTLALVSLLVPPYSHFWFKVFYACFQSIEVALMAARHPVGKTIGKTAWETYVKMSKSMCQMMWGKGILLTDEIGGELGNALFGMDVFAPHRL